MQQKPLRWYHHDEGTIMTALGIRDWVRPDQPVLLKDPIFNPNCRRNRSSVGEAELKFLNPIAIEQTTSFLCKSVTRRSELIYKNNHLDFDLTPEQVQKLVSNCPKINCGSNELGEGY